MLKLQDRVKELTTTSGTGTLTLSGTAEAGFQAFSVLGNGTKTYYTISDVNGTDFEVGEGTYNSNTLTRDTIFESSNSGNAISLSATGSTVFVTYPAEKSSYRDIGVNRDYTASGSITAGKPLILNADNTVTQVGTTTIASGTGTLSTNTVSNAEEGQVAMGATNQFVNLYRVANSSLQYLTANTISSTDLKTITRGSTVNFDSGKERNAGIIYEPNQDKYVVIALNGNNYLTATTATFSGTGSSATLTLGTQTIIDSNVWSGSGFQNSNITYDTTAQKIVVAGTKTGANNGICIVINLNGTTFTQGSRTTVPLSSTSLYASDNLICSYSSTANKVVFLHCQNSQSDSTAINYTNVGTVSGTSISFGSAQAVGNPVDSGYSNMSKDTTLSVDNNGVIVITYLSQSYALYSQSATLSGTTLTWGSTSQISNITVLNGAFGECGSVKIADGKTVIVRATTSGSTSNADKGIFCVITVSGTSVTNGSVQEFSSSATRYPNVSSNYSKTQALINFGSGSENNIIFQESSQDGESNLTTDNYFGIASSTASTTEPVGVNRAGSFNNDQSGMTAGKDMYVTDAGLIKERTTTTVTTNSDISSSDGNEIASLGSYANDISVAYDTVNNKIGVLYLANTSNYITIAIGTETNNAITWGTPVVVKSTSGSQDHTGQKLAFGNGVFVASYVSTGEGLLKAGVYSGTNSITLGSEIRPTTATIFSKGGAIGYNDDANKFVYAFPENASSSITLFLITNSSTTLTTGNSATMTMGYSSNNKVIWNEYDPDTNKQVIMTDHLYADEGRIYQATISGANITVPSTYYAITDEGTEEDGSKALSYDPDNNKWILFKANTGNVLRANVLTVSGDTFTSGTVTQISSQYMRWLAPYYDTEQNKTVLVSNKNTSPYNGLIGFVTISGTTPSYTASATTVGNQTAERLYPQASIYNPDTKSGIAIGATPLSNTKAVGYVLYYGSTTSTVVNGSQFVGVARSGTDLELAEPPTELVGLANGSITKGKPVILRTDGDVEEVKNSITSISYSNGTESEITSGWLDVHSLSYDTVQGRFLAVYRDQDASNYGYYRTFKVSSNTISDIVSGSSFNTNSTTILDSVYIGNSKHVVLYTNSSNYLYGRVIVMASDGTCTEGTATALYTGNTHHKATCYYESTTGTVVWLGSFYYNSQKAQAVGIYVDGTNLTVGSFVDNPNNYTSCSYFSSSYDEEAQIGIVAYEDGGSNSIFNTISVTGTNTVSWNTDVVFNGSNRCKLSADGMTYDPKNKKHLCLFNDDGNSNDLYGIVATVSGTTVTHGTKALVSTESNDIPFGCQGTNGGGISYAFRDDGSPYYLKGGVITISGTSFTLSNSTTYNSTAIGSNNCVSFAYQPSDYTTVAMYEENSGHDLQAVAIVPEGSITVPNLTATNFIGFAKNTVADNEDVKVTTIGQTDDNQSSLTTASQYYVQNDATLSTTAGTPSVLGGTALSSTKILIKS